jgi:hypothetical protein
VLTCFAGIQLRRCSGEPVVAWKILSPIPVRIKIAAESSKRRLQETGYVVARDNMPLAARTKHQITDAVLAGCNLTFLS